jgi:hypothetical protein
LEWDKTYVDFFPNKKLKTHIQTIFASKVVLFLETLTYANFKLTFVTLDRVKLCTLGFQVAKHGLWQAQYVNVLALLSINPLI